MVSRSGPCSEEQVVYSSWPPVFSGHELSLLLLREARPKLTLWNDLSWAIALARKSEWCSCNFAAQAQKIKKTAPFAMQTSWDHVLKNKKKEFGQMTCREFYLKFQCLIRLDDKGAPFGIQLVNHSLLHGSGYCGSSPLYYPLFIPFYFLNKYSHNLSSRSRNDNQTEAIPQFRQIGWW